MSFRRCLLLGLLVVAFLLTPERVSAQATIEPEKKYQEAVKNLDAFIAREVRTKRLPALSIALVSDQTVVWAKGFGFADRAAGKPATAETVYRVGSVSKLFTDLAIIQLVERGTLDLDVPITKFLPDFKPINPFDKPITLRQLMTHRSGLVREPPIGNYFDPDGPSLAKSVESLNKTTLVYPPESRLKYSNAAIGTVGLVIEETQNQPFVRYLQRTLLAPLGMKKSSFEPDPEIIRDLAKAVMWTYHGREFPAPTFELGMPPAGSMYTTVLDLSKFMEMVFAGGKTPNGALVKPESLEMMFTPQFVKPGEKTGVGLGFFVNELEGRKRLGHGGAIYGFATDLSFLPGEKLGVAVVASRDCANGIVSHIAEEALKQILAVKLDKPLPKIEESAPLDREQAKKLAGRWQAGAKFLELIERDGRLGAFPERGGFRVEVRSLGKDLIVDDVLTHGPRIVVDGDKLKIGNDAYTRVERPPVTPAPDRWAGLIGEYGWDHNTLFIFEKNGKLHALIEWFFLYPLEEEKPDTFKFPDLGLYHGEKLIFTRDTKGRANQVEAASVVFERRKLDGEFGTFKIRPIRPLDEIRREALAAKPTERKGKFREPELVDLAALDPTLKLDIRYATTNNFLGTPLYTFARAYLQKPAAEALVRVHKKLADQGLGLLIHDGYRPWAVTKIFWEATPPKWRHFVANPAGGSRHNRGCAVDLTLYDRQTGRPVVMPGGYDEMSDRSYEDYLGGTTQQRVYRETLRRAMEAEGFAVYEAEWWHFDYKDWAQYPILNVTFEDLEKQGGKK